MNVKAKIWFCTISGSLFAMQGLACFRQRNAIAALPISHFLNSFFAVAALIVCALYFTIAFRTYKALSPVPAPARTPESRGPHNQIDRLPELNRQTI